MRKILFLFPVLILTILLTALTSKGFYGYEAGDRAEDFVLKGVDGQQYSLSSFKEVQGYIIVFTCNTCQYVRKYEQRMIDLHQTYAPQGYPVIAINPNFTAIVPGDSFDEMKKQAKMMKYPFVYLADSDGMVAYKFGATETPQVFVLDKNRVVKYIGAIDDNVENAHAASVKYVEKAIEALKRGKNPDTQRTKVEGCVVKRKGMDP